MKLAVVGATGLVGRTMLSILEERNFPIDELILAASEKSVGKQIEFRGAKHSIISVDETIAKHPHIALFSAGGAFSLARAKDFTAVGCRVIDNSSAWRMDQSVPLVVPEINMSSVSENDLLIANPNCSTIQMVLALFRVHEVLGIKRLVISTYQSVGGSGEKGQSQLRAERNSESTETFYPHKIDMNVIPHCDDFMANGYTKEELKMVNETCKILRDPSLAITATAVRVPVMGAHSESVNVELKKHFQLETVKRLIGETPGVSLLDDHMKNSYPMPSLAEGKDDVFVGRLRRDESLATAFNMWIVADNLRKGAATNAVQIAEELIKRN